MLVPEWVMSARVKRAALPTRRIGAAALIDERARLRARDCVSLGISVSLSRTVSTSASVSSPGEQRAYELTSSVRHEGRFVVARDRLVAENHGMVNTHVDGLNHFGLDGSWHGDVPAEIDMDDGPSVADWSEAGLITRGVMLDIPAVRQTPWVAGGRPVDAADLDASVELGGISPEPGDALLLYMGRDEFEAAGHTYGVVTSDVSEPRPGIGPNGLRWIANRDPSILAWDMMEASDGSEGTHYLGHLLIWALGLIIVDNCDFHAARAKLAQHATRAALLSIAPLKLPQATGCLVNPLLLFLSVDRCCQAANLWKRLGRGGPTIST
jgi:kynurenine formamidase